MNLEDIIITALKREQEPPRVPSFVQGIMEYFTKQWMEKYEDDIEEQDIAITPVKDITMHIGLGFDSSWCGFNGPSWIVPKDHEKIVQRKNQQLSAQERAEGYHISNFGGLYKTVHFFGHDHNFLVGGTIKTEDEWNEWFENWDIRQPSGDPIGTYNTAKKQALNLRKPHLLIPACGIIMEPMISMLDLGRISNFARRKPQFFRKVIDFIMKPTYQKFKMMCESDAPVLITPDDCAYKGRPILSPEHYKEFIIPHFKKLIDMAHRAGKLQIFHSDGMVEPYYPALVEAGLDAHQSLEPVAGNDIAAIKAKWGDKLSIIGNMDSEVLLPFGTKDEVIETTKRTLKAAMPGGGYMFSPCTDLTDSCKLENVETMMATWKKYGNYPVNIP
jgi:hypothetical protein